MKTLRTFLVAGSLAVATPVLAHTGGHEIGGFFAGFLHPLRGIDHVMAMASVGLFAALLGGKAAWSVPASFIAMMLIGGAIGFAGIGVPAAELGIAASIVVTGMLIAWGRAIAPAAAMAVAGFFAIFHGYAHGIEIPIGSPAVTYSVGFALASLVLHLVGLGAGRSVLRHSRTPRVIGAAVSAAGLWMALV